MTNRYARTKIYALHRLSQRTVHDSRSPPHALQALACFFVENLPSPPVCKATKPAPRGPWTLVVSVRRYQTLALGALPYTHI